MAVTSNIKRHIQHQKSSLSEGGGPKLPTAEQLYYGEIAVNYGKGTEAISIKNSNDEIVTFRLPDNELDSGSTNPISNSAVTEALNSVVAYLDDLDKTPQVTGTAAASVTIDPYKMYDFGTVSTAMTIAFNTSKEVAGYTKEYMIRFVAGNGCSITLPSTVLYANGQAPTYTSGKTYELDVVNGCVVVGEFY